MDPFLNKGFNWAILQEWEELPNLTERLHSSLIGFDKTREPSFRKRPESSSIPAALQTFAFLEIFSVSISIVYVKWKASVWKKISIILYYRVKIIVLWRGRGFFKKLSTKVE